MIDSHHPHQMVDDVYEVLKGGLVARRQKGREDGRADDTSLFSYSLNSLIRLVAG